MPNNFYYAASTYLDEWMGKDRAFHKILGHERKEATTTSEGTKCLVEVATYYRVIRTLKVIDEGPRLNVAYDALQAIEVLNEADVVQKVEKFSVTLKEKYGSVALSASSKFLWMRFQSPVVIYDSIVSEWLCKHCDYKYEGYARYYEIWLTEYWKYESQIREACEEVSSIKKFTLACDLDDDELQRWISSQWFLQRVFDHYIINASTWADMTRLY